MGYILTAIVIALAAFAYHLHESLDIGRAVYNHQPGMCRSVQGIVNGSEDVELVRSEGIAFVSSGVMDKKSKNGKIFLYDFAQKSETDQLKALELPIRGDSFDKNFFRPHGLTHWIVNGVIRLYVICHSNEDKHSVQIFDYDRKKQALIHKKTIKDPLFIKPNGIVAVGADQFMITNDGVAQTEFWMKMEILFAYKGGSVVFWDGKESHTILSNMYGPNGIAYDVKSNKLFVTEVNYKRLHAYELAKDKKSTTLLSTVDLHSAGDNLYLHSDGSLFIGCHPRVHEIAVALGDCNGPSTSASQVLRVKYDKDYKTASITESYANDGKDATGSSVAIVYEKQMLIGTVCKNLLHCEISDVSLL